VDMGRKGSVTNWTLAVSFEFYPPCSQSLPPPSLLTISPLHGTRALERHGRSFSLRLIQTIPAFFS
jgi:hypothetical protein